jgi:hypothetical protein
MNYKLVLLLFISASIVSCERKLRPPEIAGSGSSGLIGKWNLVSTGGTTIASSEIDLLGNKMRAENTLIYTSSNPKGFYDITSTEFRGNGIGYDFSGSLIVKLFENNVLQSEIRNPFPTSTIAPSNPVSKYRLIGTDSIYFEGSAPAVQYQGGGNSTVPSGCKYSLTGNTLTLKMKYSITYVSNNGGVISNDSQSADVSVVLTKQ